MDTSGELERRLHDLPRRALVAFALRCTNRVEVLRAREQRLVEAYTAGVEPTGWCGSEDDDLAESAGITAEETLFLLHQIEDDDTAFRSAGNIARWTASVARQAGDGGSTPSAILRDLDVMTRLNLGRAGEPGEPVRWDDPRLGPLWPDGPPAWHVEAETQCREIEAKLRELAEPPVAPPGEAQIARNDIWKRLDRQWSEGILDQYARGYVITDGETIFAHGWNLVEARDQAEAAARAAGVDTDRLIDYFVHAAD